MMTMEIIPLEGIVATAAVFFLVQILVYLILSKSSDVFSKNTKRSLSFRHVRSLSIRRILAALSDVPSGGEPSPPNESPSPFSIGGECAAMFRDGSS
ncbi:uncharacterized protein LOC111016209 [Momordica charantia]|uniref:Uncharacterized protein LOC111016209 n=1 Tax=Momordica charantia TaxID=3673 RepID=A0A6J1D0M4_MOMCH|nr:uncharacterized protein LOC111016209 [Momordica charantia]